MADFVALVTGGGRGIGKSVSLELAKRGAHVVVNYSRSSDAAEAVKKEIESAGGSAETVAFDVSDSTAVDTALKLSLIHISEPTRPY